MIPDAEQLAAIERNVAEHGAVPTVIGIMTAGEEYKAERDKARAELERLRERLRDVGQETLDRFLAELVDVPKVEESPQPSTKPIEPTKNYGYHGHVWPCPLFYVNNWTDLPDDRPRQGCALNDGCPPIELTDAEKLARVEAVLATFHTSAWVNGRQGGKTIAAELWAEVHRALGHDVEVVGR